MSAEVLISIDAMGGDHGPSVAVPGAALALERFRAEGREARFLLHGDRAKLEPELARRTLLPKAVEIRHTEQVIAGDEKASVAMRRGKGSSLWNAVEAVKGQPRAAAVSAGNTGALMAISKLQLRMAAGLSRPAIAASWPTARGVSVLLDVGANIDSDAGQLIEFAIMGEAFFCAVHGGGPGRPSIGLLNVGSEDQKGHEEVREAHQVLRSGRIDLDYRGFVEGDDIAKGTVDVVVTDGFTGNIVLKTGEGLARFVGETLRATLTSSVPATLGAVLASSALKRMREKLEPPGGGVLLGLNGTVVKAHGGGTPKAFADAIRMAADLAASGYAGEVARNVERLGPELARAKGAADAAGASA